MATVVTTVPLGTDADSQKHIAVANAAIGGADQANKVIDAVENDDVVKNALVAVLGPYLRTYGNSPAVGAIAGLVVWELAHYGVTIDPQFAISLCVLAMVGAAYGWQKFSMWRGKKNAPITTTTV